MEPLPLQPYTKDSKTTLRRRPRVTSLPRRNSGLVIGGHLATIGVV